ncbi:MAG: hypothetical protein A2046_04565 [Bacteroidetes bacterium GWA2_30_7]|nr:MAG: hypothetical protein A2046_04565 [Bacteroidetes bacterium GWA2_30_7]
MRGLLIIFIFFIAFLNSNLYGQKKVSFDFVLTSDFCFRSLKADAGIPMDIAKSRNSIEKPKIAYKLGIAFNYNINRFSVSLGLLFSKRTYKTLSQSNFLLPDQLDPLYGYNNVPNNSSLSIKKITFLFNYFCIDIPISIKYNLINKKYKFYVFSGLEPNLFISAYNKSIIKHSDGSKSKSSNKDLNDFNKINLSYFGGVGFQHVINDSFAIKVEPFFERNLFSIINAPIKEYLYSYGINLKLSYH